MMGSMRPFVNPPRPAVSQTIVFRIAQAPAPTLACLSTVPRSKTRPTIIVSLGVSADGFRDTDRVRYPAGQTFRFLEPGS